MIRVKPDLLHIAKARVETQIANNPPKNPCDAVYEWQNILNTWSFGDVLSFIVSDTEKADQLRQSTPFVGYMDNAERWKLIKAFYRMHRELEAKNREA